MSIDNNNNLKKMNYIVGTHTQVESKMNLKEVSLDEIELHSSLIDEGDKEVL